MIRFAVFGRAAALAVLVSSTTLVSGLMVMPARAQDVPEAHLTAAKDAIKALSVTDRYDNILPNLSERLKAQFIQASPNYQAQISAVVDEQALALASRRADLEKEAATIYAKSFSVDQLKAISTFFNTEAGKKLLTDQPLVSRELVRAAEIWANGISRDLTNQSTEKLRGIIDSTPIAAPVAEVAPAPTVAPAPARPAPAATRPTTPAPAATPPAPGARPPAATTRPAPAPAAPKP